MESKDFKQHIGRALAKEGFVRSGRCWRKSGADFVWIVLVEKVPSWQRSWSVRIGLAFRDGDPPPDRSASDCEIVTDYEFLGQRVPEAAKVSRFDDHRSYFAMTLDVSHDLMTDAESLAAFEFMARDLAMYVESIATTADLRQALVDGVFRGILSWQARARIEQG